MFMVEFVHVNVGNSMYSFTIVLTVIPIFNIFRDIGENLFSIVEKHTFFNLTNLQVL
jgi:hypothetical protein